MFLDLGETLFFFVHADGDELDDRLGDAEAALDFSDELGGRGYGEQDIETVVELLYGVGEAAAAHLFGGLDFSTTGGDVAGEGLDELVEIALFDVGSNDKHDFVRAIHSASFCGVLPRTARFVESVWKVGGTTIRVRPCG